MPDQPQERENSQEDFAPIFIVGPGRAGTTFLAVLLDRHSRLSVPPETHFFSRFLPEIWEQSTLSTHEQMVDAALAFERIAEAELDREHVLGIFRDYAPTSGNLLRAILESYALTHGAVRPAEKSPIHVEHVPEIFRLCPKAKVIAIVRDGRDVVLSTMKVGWREGNPRRFGIFCARWAMLARLMLEYQSIYPSDRYTLVKYEDLVLRPQEEVQRLCAFIGEDFEPGQLDPNVATGTIPDREEAWKGRARLAPDPSRVAAWRKHDNRDQIWAMNCMMGSMLRRFGYPDTTLDGCPLSKRIRFHLNRLPYLEPLQPVAVFGLKVLRKLGFKIP